MRTDAAAGGTPRGRARELAALAGRLALEALPRREMRGAGAAGLLCELPVDESAAAEATSAASTTSGVWAGGSGSGEVW